MNCITAEGQSLLGSNLLFSFIEDMKHECCEHVQGKNIPDKACDVFNILFMQIRKFRNFKGTDKRNFLRIRIIYKKLCNHVTSFNKKKKVFLERRKTV